MAIQRNTTNALGFINVGGVRGVTITVKDDKWTDPQQLLGAMIAAYKAGTLTFHEGVERTKDDTDYTEFLKGL